jgi:hypothetical protein
VAHAQLLFGLGLEGDLGLAAVLPRSQCVGAAFGCLLVRRQRRVRTLLPPHPRPAKRTRTHTHIHTQRGPAHVRETDGGAWGGGSAGVLGRPPCPCPCRGRSVRPTPVPRTYMHQHRAARTTPHSFPRTILYSPPLSSRMTCTRVRHTASAATHAQCLCMSVGAVGRPRRRARCWLRLVPAVPLPPPPLPLLLLLLLGVRQRQWAASAAASPT